MPELPEVETIRLQLDKALTGLEISDVEVLSKKNFIGNAESLIGRKIVSVNRRAKVILIELDNGYFIAIHLKMTGQLIYRENSNSHAELVSASSSISKKIPKQVRDDTNVSVRDDISMFAPYDVSVLPNKYTRVIINLNKAKLYFNDLRKFGWCKIVRDLREIGNYGPEPFDKEFTVEYLKGIFGKTSKPVKIVLLDQEKIAGIGNIYASEVLFKAGILPTRKAKSLSSQEITNLRSAIIEILTEAIKKKGTSDKDEAYRQINGDKGSYQNYLKVYNREDEQCFNCRGKIKKIKVGGRGTFYCPKCQK